MKVTLKERANPSNTLRFKNVVSVVAYMGQDGSDTPAIFAQIVTAGSCDALHFNLKQYWMEVREQHNTI